MFPMSGRASTPSRRNSRYLVPRPGRAVVRLLAALFILSLIAPARVAHGAPRGLVGTWLGEIFGGGYQETLILFENGAYKSTTVIADPVSLKESLATDCRTRIRPKRPQVRCDAAWVEGEFAKLTGLFPQTYIGTVEIRGPRISFTHGCAEEARDCTAGSSQEAGVYFVDETALTIKLDGVKYKGKVIGAVTSTYKRLK